MSVDKAGAKYFKYGLWLIVAMFVIGMMYDRLNNIFVQWDLMISTVYAVVSLAVYAVCWKSVAKASKSALARFYMVASVLRMLAALLVFVVYCFIDRQYDHILRFAVYFLTFYIVMLVYNVVFFARVEKTLKKEI